MAENSNITVYKLLVDDSNGKVKIDGLTKSFVKSDTALKKLNQTIDVNNKKLSQGADKTGLAGAAAIEFSRTISDWNYGFRAVANNLSQLITLLVTLVATTKSVSNAWKVMKATLSGPIGIIVLFQVLITVIEAMTMKAEKAEREAKKLTEAFKAQTLALKALVEIAVAEEESSGKREVALRALAKMHKELASVINNEKSTYDQINRSIQNYLTIKMLEDQANAASKALHEQFNETERDRIKLTEKIAVLTKRLEIETRLYNKAKEEEGANADRVRSKTNKYGYAVTVTTNALRGATTRLNEINSERNAIQDEYLRLLEEQRKAELERLANSPRSVSYWENEISKIEKLRDSVATTAEEFNNYNKVIAIYQKEIDKITGGKFLDNFIEGDKFFEDIFDYYKDASDKYKKYLESEEDEPLFPITSYTPEDLINELEVEESLAEIERKRKEDEEKRKQRLNDRIAVANATKEVLSGLADFAAASYDREITLEINKTNAINNQLKARLRNEALSMEERKNIQNKIAQNDEALRKKQEAIEKKKFEMQKAAGLAEAMVNTFTAATGVLKDTKGGSIARIAGMIAVIGAGLAQVAVIAKQKFKTSAAAMTGGVTNVDTGDGGALSGPSFNVVGQSGSNQLARAVSGQLSKPVKAYVVSKDVSTSQEMDRNVVKTASLG